MTEIKLPPLVPGDHPEYRVMAWSKLEMAAIQAYAREAIALNATPTGMEAPAAEPVANDDHSELARLKRSFNILLSDKKLAEENCAAMAKKLNAAIAPHATKSMPTATADAWGAFCKCRSDAYGRGESAEHCLELMRATPPTGEVAKK